MKITRTAEEAKAAEERKRIANIDCDKCPCCGETEIDKDYIIKGFANKGIIHWQKTWHEGCFGLRTMHCDCYSCSTCGAQWQSEPYEGI